MQVTNNYATFDGLNVSSKFAICGLPIRIDSYKTCSFGCKYCFANGRKIMEFKKDLQIANVKTIQSRLERVFNKHELHKGNLLDTLLNNRITWHFGGMSDPFQPINEELGITNQIIDIGNKYGVSMLISTKTDNIHDANVRPDLHTFQLSVSNVYNRTDIEENVPDINKRVQLFNYLKRNGFKVGIRIQPFIPNISNIDIIKMFENADHYIIEGIKVVPQNEEQKQFVFNYLGIKEEMFTQLGLLNILPQYRLRYYEPFIEYFKSHGLSYSISDNDLRKYSNNACCCGDRLVKKATNFNTTSLIMEYGGKYTIKQANEKLIESGVYDCKCSELFTSNRAQGINNVKHYFNVKFKQKNNPLSPYFQYNGDLQLEMFQ